MVDVSELRAISDPASIPALRFLRSDDADPPVTVIREIRVRPGAEGRFELLMGALMAEATRQPGHLGATVLRPRGEHERHYRFVYKFERRSHMNQWHASPLRASLFEPISELIEWDRFSEYPGLETWFDLPAELKPTKWRTTLLSWAAIYLLVVAGSYALRATGLKLPIPVAAFILTAVIVPLVAFIIAPAMGRVFGAWLHAGNSR